MTSEPKEERKSIAQDVEGIDQSRTEAGDGVDSPTTNVAGTSPDQEINPEDISF